MSTLEKLTELIADQTSRLAPITLTVPSPSTSILQLSQFVHHVTTTPIHPVYLPYLRFGAIHAARVTTVWAVMTKGRKGKVGVLQDLFGYLVLAWGGSTVTSLLLGQAPSWLISPTPWIIYPSVYALLVPTGLSSYITSTAPALLFNITTAFVDGMTRSTSLSALPALVAASTTGIAANASWWTYALLSALGITSGGLIVGLLGLNEASWTIGVPSLLKGGVLGTLDAWGAALVGLVYLALTAHIEEVAPLGEALAAVLPADVTHGAQGKAIVDPLHARAICVLLFGSLLAVRAVALAWQGRKVGAKKPAVAKKTEVLVTEEKGAVVKSPVKVKPDGTGKPTPRKSPRVRSRASTPAK
ncbi:hypothetical protein IAT38_005514 [Cryptococcus sp. DSM 104549]